MENEFIDIIGFEGKYKINKIGNVFSMKTNKILKQSTAGAGYFKVSLCSGNGSGNGGGGKSKGKYIHRLLAINFIPNPDNLSQVDHIDRNKHNNNLDNLRWVSHLTNMRNADKIINNGNISFRQAKNGPYYTAEYSIDYYTRIRKCSYDLQECETFLEECLINYPRSIP